MFRFAMFNRFLFYLRMRGAGNVLTLPLVKGRKCGKLPMGII